MAAAGLGSAPSRRHQQLRCPAGREAQIAVIAHMTARSTRPPSSENAGTGLNRPSTILRGPSYISRLPTGQRPERGSRIRGIDMQRSPDRRGYPGPASVLRANGAFSMVFANSSAVLGYMRVSLTRSVLQVKRVS
jgi:hypothetical protein